MREWFYFAIISACFSMDCVAQAPPPTSTYTFQARKQPRGWSLVESPTPPSTALAVTPSGALLVLIPQPERKWVFKQLSSWSTPLPKEQTIVIGEAASRNGEAWYAGNLTVTRDGNYALIRIASSRHSYGADHYARDAEAVIILVDLHAFSIIYRRTTADPLIAGAQWQLAKDGLLISKAVTRRSRTKTQNQVAATDDYQVAALSFPDLKPSASCHYTKLLKTGGTEWFTEKEKTALVNCDDVLQAAGVASLDELPGNEILPTQARTVNAPPKCGVTRVSDDGRYTLCECSDSHPTPWDTVKTTSRSVLVLTTANSATVLSIALKVQVPIITTLADAGGRQYLLLLQDGIKLEVYRLP
jgi:hypothetical protein